MNNFIHSRIRSLKVTRDLRRQMSPSTLLTVQRETDILLTSIAFCSVSLLTLSRMDGIAYN
jgi:hypothetical protein